MCVDIYMYVLKAAPEKSMTMISCTLLGTGMGRKRKNRPPKTVAGPVGDIVH